MRYEIRIDEKRKRPVIAYIKSTGSPRVTLHTIRGHDLDTVEREAAEWIAARTPTGGGDMMTDQRRPYDLIDSARADLERAETALRAERATVKRLASNDLARTHPNYRILVLLARLQDKRWEIADLEIEVLYRTKPTDSVLAPGPRLGWRDRLRRLLGKWWASVRRCRSE